MVSNIEIKKENLLAAYDGASVEQKNLLELLFGKETFKPQNIMDRVRTYEDACEVLDISPVLNSPNLCICEKHERSAEMHEHFSFRQSLDKQAIAYLKLCVITSALNEGWTPQFTEDEYRYYPWFWLYKNREEWENDGGDAWRKEHPYRELGGDYKTEYAGFACAYSSDAPSPSDTSVGSRLCFKNSDLAAYCGTQFADLWMDYFLVRKSDNLINGEE